MYYIDDEWRRDLKLPDCGESRAGRDSDTGVRVPADLAFLQLKANASFWAMLLGLCGGICAGKRSVTDFLVAEQGFHPLSIEQGTKARSAAAELALSHFPEATPFKDVESLLDFVTKRWRERWVITAIWDESILEALLRRPFFLLVSVDAPVTVRWLRFRARCEHDQQTPLSLEEFVLENDRTLYDARHGLAHVVDRAQLRLLNSSQTLSTLHNALRTLNLTDDQRMRPSWDQYFMQLALLAAQRSNCMKRRVGCVLVREKRVISTGYNGTPRNLINCNEGGCPRCNNGHGSGAGLATCLCLHAEENALLEAGRERIREGTTLYCDTCPCLTCSIKIAQVGISEVVYSQSYSMDSETAALFKDAGVHLRQFSPPRNGLVDLGIVLNGVTANLDAESIDTLFE